MAYNNYESDASAAYRQSFRRKLADLFLNEYSVRRDRGELLYAGRWITPDRKYDFMDELKVEHRHLVQDSILGLVVGFLGAVILVVLIKYVLFPS
jgi:hypothetical protein